MDSQGPELHGRIPLLAGVALLSGSALAFEILLIRIFAIADWHHLAFLVLSLALLGYGASGTFLALARETLLSRWAVASSLAAVGFAISAPGSLLLYERLEFNSLEIIWSGRQLALMFVVYVLFAIPMFAAATAIGLVFSRHGRNAPVIYRADLIGAGAGAIAVTMLLFVLHPVTCLQLAAGMGAVAAALFAHAAQGTRRRDLLATSLLALVAVAAVRPLLLPLPVSQFKELSHALRVPGSRVVATAMSPLGIVTAVESPDVPFRFAPGLSLNFAGTLPEQIALFTDGGGMSVISRLEGEPLGHHQFLPSAVPYHVLREVRHTVVVGAGGGAEVLSALHHGSKTVTAVEVERQVIDLVAIRFRAFSGGLYTDRRVRVANVDARRFITDSTERFDVIQLSLVDSLGASASGAQALTENFLYTVEAFDAWLRHLEPGGVLVVTRWMQVPPRDIVKLFATAVRALERAGASPREHLAIIRSWNTVTLLVKRNPFTAAEIQSVRRFCDERSFDLDYGPGVTRNETNQYNVLDDSYVFDSATAISGGDRDDFFRRYKFDVRPATDERPFFSHYFKWSVFPELFRLRARGAMPLMEWGYLVVVAALVQALIASLVLILLPLFLIQRRSPGSMQVRASHLVLCFSALGLAFLFVEIAFIQRLTLFLGHPIFAIGLVLAAFLVFAGIGSGLSRHIHDGRRIAWLVAVFAILELILLRILPAVALGLPTAVKVAGSVLLIAPLAILMGMPFPIALRHLAERDSRAVPWAWGINGAASALSSMCATLLAVHAGFSGVVVAAATLYVIAGWTLGRMVPRLSC